MNSENDFADVIVVEVCKTIENLRNKRSRYMPSTSGLRVTIRGDWLLESAAGQTRPRWEALDLPWEDVGEDAAEHDFYYGVRHLRVLYAIPNVEYPRWKSNHVPLGHEFYCRHSSLGSYSAQKMQGFFAGLGVGSHFYTER